MKTNAPAVSVIIPTFNRADWLPKTVQSVQNQIFTDFEILVVDDGSTDDTENVVGGLSGARYLKLEPASGVSAARNLGFNHSLGRYICFLDSDDLWQDDKLKIQFELMQTRPDCVISYTDEIWVRNGVRVNPMNKHKKYCGNIFQYCLPLCIVSPSSVMMRRSLLSEVGGFDEALPACEDYDLWLRIAARYPMYFIDKKLIVKRGGHEDQLSKKYWGMDRFRVYALEKLLYGEVLELEQKFQVLETLIEKSGILVKGFAKRKKEREAEYYNRKVEKYTALLEGKESLENEIDDPFRDFEDLAKDFLFP